MVRALVILLLAFGAALSGCGEGQRTEPTVAAGGKIAFVSERDDNSEIYVINADGSGLTNLTNHPSNDGKEGFNAEANFAWSPDGKRIAFVSDRDDDGVSWINSEIYVMNADGTDQTRLTTTEAIESHPRWSPDGKRVAYVSTIQPPPDYDQTIYIMNADGSGRARLLPEGQSGNYPAWSPHGSQLAFENGDIFVVNADGSGLEKLTNTDDDYFAPSWSPDGSRIAFDSYRDSTIQDKPGVYQQIFVVNLDGADQIHIPKGAKEDDYYASPRWSPDRERILFFSDEGLGANLHLMNIDGSDNSRITDTGMFAGEWSPQGDHIAAFGLEASGQGMLGGALYIMDGDGSHQTKLTSDVAEPHIAWFPIP